MSLGGFNQDEIAVVSVTFDDRWVEITYVEPEGVSPRVQHIHTLRVDPQLEPEAVADVLSELRDIVSAALVEARNPPQSFSAPR